MKVCPNCQQKYTDDNLNFCLNDGGVLTAFDDAPPTVMMNQARVTNDNWSTHQDPFAPQSWQSQPLQTQQSNAPFQPAGQNMPFAAPNYSGGGDQTMPIIALVLGILSLLLVCCYGGFYFGLAAIIIGFIGMNNANKNPQVYSGKGLALAGLILGGVSFIGTILLVIIAIAAQ